MEESREGCQNTCDMKKRKDTGDDRVKVGIAVKKKRERRENTNKKIKYV